MKTNLSFHKKKDSVCSKQNLLLRGATRIWTGESWICSPLPYHLAMAPAYAEYVCIKNWSGLRGSNSLPPPWQGGALPDELKPQVVPQARVELATRGFSVRCSTYWATEANYKLWWEQLDSNQWPPACKAGALTSWAMLPRDSFVIILKKTLLVNS